MENKNIAFYENENLWTITLNSKKPEHIWNLLWNELSIKLNWSILELWSWTWVYFDFLKNSEKLTSIELTDINKEILKSKGYSEVIKHDLNIYPYPIEDNSCDFILFSHVIEHLYSPILALNECFRILKPGGILLLWVPNSDSKIYNNWDFEWHYYAMNYKWWNFLLKQSWFSVEKMYVNWLIFNNKTYLKLLQPFFKFVWLDPWFICKKI